MNQRQRPSRAKDLNAPEHWLAWLRACQTAAKKDPKHPFGARTVPLGAITGQDARALRAFAACLSLLSQDDNGRVAAITALRALLPAMQPVCWPFARELVAQQGEWSDRDRVWLQLRQLVLVELKEAEVVGYDHNGYPAGHITLAPTLGEKESAK